MSLAPAMAQQEEAKPNNLVIWGDDIGTWNFSHRNLGMMGSGTPNIDRIAREDAHFANYPGQKSGIAAAFMNGSVPVRAGVTKVGLAGAGQGCQESDVIAAGVAKSPGYATGQFGKVHQGGQDEHLPTNHEFDQFVGNLYRLNAEEEPENRDYPADMILADGSTFLDTHGPRGVIKPEAGGEIEDSGPLTKETETADEETLAEAKGFIRDKTADNEPWFVLWKQTRMHVPTYIEEAHTGLSDSSGNEYHDRMVEHHMHVVELLDLRNELGVANNTVVFYSNVNGPYVDTWPDAATTYFRSGQNSNWEGVWREPFIELRVPIRQLAVQFLRAMQDCPPSQSPGSNNLSTIEEKLKKRLAGLQRSATIPDKRRNACHLSIA